MSDEKKPLWEMTAEMRSFEATMQLKDLKAGDVLTDRHMRAINVLLGKLFEAARKIPLTQITIAPNAEGKLVETSKTGLIKSIEMIED